MFDQRPRDPEQQRGFDFVGRAIRRRRHSLGWTQRFLEAQSGIDQTVISRIENGRQYGLRWKRFADLVGALGGLDGLGPPSPRMAARGGPGSAFRRVVDLTKDSQDLTDDPADLYDED